MTTITSHTVKKELPACPVETTLTLISDKWKVLILRDLLTGTKRFGELQRSIGHVSQKVLTSDPEGLCRGSAPGGIHPDGAWLQPEAHHGCHVDLGRELSGAE